MGMEYSPRRKRQFARRMRRQEAAWARKASSVEVRQISPNGSTLERSAGDFNASTADEALDVTSNEERAADITESAGCDESEEDSDSANHAEGHVEGEQ